MANWHALFTSISLCIENKNIAIKLLIIWTSLIASNFKLIKPNFKIKNSQDWNSSYISFELIKIFNRSTRFWISYIIALTFTNISRSNLYQWKFSKFLSYKSLLSRLGQLASIHEQISDFCILIIDYARNLHFLYTLFPLILLINYWRKIGIYYLRIIIFYQIFAQITWTIIYFFRKINNFYLILTKILKLLIFSKHIYNLLYLFKI